MLFRFIPNAASIFLSPFSTWYSITWAVVFNYVRVYLRITHRLIRIYGICFCWLFSDGANELSCRHSLNSNALEHTLHSDQSSTPLFEEKKNKHLPFSNINNCYGDNRKKNRPHSFIRPNRNGAKSKDPKLMNHGHQQYLQRFVFQW